MATWNKKQIQQKAMEVLGDYPNGIRWTEILRAVENAAAQEGAPDTKHNTVHGSIRQLLSGRTDVITKVARGTYQLAKFVEAEGSDAAAVDAATASDPIMPDQAVGDQLTEQDFYASFAEWLVENDEATVAEPLGGNSLGGKWGTPDVIGVLKPRAGDIFKFEPQIITAEIKAVTKHPVVAFGQSVAYRLFSHKSYIVVPKTTGSDDMNRLKSLCSIHGVGLITFSLERDIPDYTVIVLPIVASPDMFYVNNMLDRLKLSDSNLLNRLF